MLTYINQSMTQRKARSFRTSDANAMRRPDEMLLPETIVQKMRQNYNV